MKKTINPLILVCNNNEIIDIKLYELKEDFYKVKDNESKLSFCFNKDYLNLKSIIESDFVNDNKFFLLLKKRGVLEKFTEKKNVFYYNLLAEKISYIISHLEECYEF